MITSNVTTEKKQIAILGSTGSIGTQTLNVISKHPDIMQATLLSANENVKLLSEQAIRFGVRDAVICNESKYEELKRLLDGSGINAHAGMNAVCDLIVKDGVDIVVAAMVGFSGLRSTIAALKAGKTVALANKETMVAAGEIVTGIVKEYGSSIIPVDSEHSAIFQCLQGNVGQNIAKIHLTASGGPFRTWTREQIAAATKESALKHPQWNMGAKVTIDSASMMNKGLEMIEARWFFDVAPEKINIVVHPQSIIHSMVEFDDGAVLAQLGCPDMREPIQYAITYPERISLDNRKLDFAALGTITFEAPDFHRFPCLGLAFEAICRGGVVPAAMNAANEVAVKAFLEDRIGIYDIADVISKTMSRTPAISAPSTDDIFSANDEAKNFAAELLR